MADVDDDPRAQVQALVADARHAFATDVDALLGEIRWFVRGFGDSAWTVSREDALRALRAFVLEKFDQRLPLRSLADPLMRQLLREAYEAIDDIQASRETAIDLRDWLKAAAPFVGR